MIHGHICRNSKANAREQMENNPSEVICSNCGEVTGLTVKDYGFGDDFGGVSDYQCVTKCCEAPEWFKGCDACGEVKPLKKDSDNYWYCSACLTLIKEET